MAVNWLQVVEVLWNMESTVLAVWCEALSTDGASSNDPHSYGSEKVMSPVACMCVYMFHPASKNVLNLRSKEE